MISRSFTVTAVLITLLTLCPRRASADQFADALKAEMGPKIPEYERMYADMRTGIQQLDRDSFEPGAIVEQVGRDPAKLHAWVRDQTRPLPYQGALRGSMGVLMERAGNSCDRSLLLADLLLSVGYETRLANAKLSPDQAKAVLAEIQTAASSAAGAPDKPIVQKTRQRVDAIRDHLLKDLALSASATAQADAAQQTRLVEAVADDWWVQAKIDGKWVDFQLSSLTGLKPARTIDVRSRNGPLPLASADCHEIDFKVIIESFGGGRLKTDTVLQRTFRAAELLGHTMRVSHFAGGIPDGDVTHADTQTVQKIRAALLKQETFVPALRIDDRAFTSASFTTSGKVDPNPSLDPAGKLAGATGQVMGGMFGGLGGGGATPATDGVLTGEWIEYQIRSPGKKPVVVRREIFDLIGPATRSGGIQKAPQFTEDQRLTRALKILGFTSILVKPCELSPEFIAYRQAGAELSRQPTWLALARGEFDTLAKIKRALKKTALPDETPELFAAIAGELSSTQKSTFADAPNIVHHQRWLELDAKGVFTFGSRMDLAFTSCASIGPRSFEANVTRGIADTLAENLVFGTRGVVSENAATAYEAHAAGGQTSTLIRPGEGQKQLDTLGMQPDVLARAKADLMAGNVLLLASDSKKSWTWWRVDPASGQTVGLIETGFNGAMEERAKIDTEITELAEDWGQDITADSLENASDSQVAEWAGGHSGKLGYLNDTRKALQLNRLAIKAMQMIRMSFSG